MFLLKYLERIPSFFSHLYTLIFVLFSWVIFAFDDFSKVVLYFKAMLGFNSLTFDNASIYFVYTNLILFVVLAISSTEILKNLSNTIIEKCLKHSALVVILKNALYIFIFLSSITFLVGDSYNPFLYFRF
jgi:alginate O-acetyltransferase complex protein AlgI